MAKPEQLDGQSLPELQSLLNDFPYCQTARLLYARNLHNEESLHYNKHLKMAAVYAGDRQMLYHLIMQPVLRQHMDEAVADTPASAATGIDEPVDTQEIAPAHEVRAEPDPTPPEPIASEPVGAEPTAASEVSEPVAEEVEPVATEVTPLEDLAVPAAVETVEETPTEAPPPAKPTVTSFVAEWAQSGAVTETDEAEEQVPEIDEEPSFAQAWAERKSFENTPPTAPQAPVEEEPASEDGDLSPQSELTTDSRDIGPLEKQILMSAINASLAQDIDELAAEEEAAGEVSDSSTSEEVAEPQPVEAVPAPDSFHGWLRLLQDEKAVKVAPRAASDPGTDQHPAEAKQPSKRQLIDRFLKSDTGEPPAKAEFFSPSNMAKLSLVEDQTFVSETLADIYAKQGHTEKAIAAYEQLSLAKPEKSGYFAARIKELKAQLRKK